MSTPKDVGIPKVNSLKASTTLQRNALNGRPYLITTPLDVIEAREAMYLQNPVLKTRSFVDLYEPMRHEVARAHGLDLMLAQREAAAGIVREEEIIHDDTKSAQIQRSADVDMDR